MKGFIPTFIIGYLANIKRFGCHMLSEETQTQRKELKYANCNLGIGVCCGKYYQIHVLITSVTFHSGISNRQRSLKWSIHHVCLICFYQCHIINFYRFFICLIMGHLAHMRQAQPQFTDLNLIFIYNVNSLWIVVHHGLACEGLDSSVAWMLYIHARYKTSRWLWAHARCHHIRLRDWGYGSLHT